MLDVFRECSFLGVDEVDHGLLSSLLLHLSHISETTRMDDEDHSSASYEQLEGLTMLITGGFHKRLLKLLSSLTKSLGGGVGGWTTAAVDAEVGGGSSSSGSEIMGFWNAAFIVLLLGSFSEASASALNRKDTLVNKLHTELVTCNLFRCLNNLLLAFAAVTPAQPSWGSAAPPGPATAASAGSSRQSSSAAAVGKAQKAGAVRGQGQGDGSPPSFRQLFTVVYAEASTLFRDVSDRLTQVGCSGCRLRAPLCTVYETYMIHVTLSGLGLLHPDHYFYVTVNLTTKK